MHQPDRAIERIARRQYGAFTITQARCAGHTDATMRHRLRVGAWRRRARGVYVLAAVRSTWEQRLMAAVLHKPHSAVSGRPAAALHELVDFPRCRPEIVVPSRGSHASPLALVHRSDDVETTVLAGISVVTPTQALFDVAGTVPLPMLRRAAEDAVLRNLVSVDHLAARFEHLEPQLNHGIGDMRSVVEMLCVRRVAPAESVLETLLFELLDEIGLVHERQVTFSWRAPTPMTVDAVIPSLALIAEADGRAWHARLDAFHADRRRDLVAAAHGFETLRLSHPMLTAERAETSALLREYHRSRAELLRRGCMDGDEAPSAA